MQRAETEVMMFDRTETAAALGVPRKWIKEAVRKGAITPTVRGGPGRGNADQFTLAQVFGLMIGVWWIHDIRAGRPMHKAVFKDIVDRNADWSQAEVELMLQLRTDQSDPLTAETLAKKFGPKEKRYPSHPEDVGHAVKLADRLTRLSDAARAKLDWLALPDRMVDILRERAGLPKLSGRTK